MSSESNKRLAKNTIALYFRTFVTLLVSLYTSRVVLNVLGVNDFGIYNVVGSIVILFSFLSNALAYADQRFLTFELGRNNIPELKRVFSMSMTSVISIALIIVFFAETTGLWFLNNKLNIPADRMHAAKWTYQLSILIFCINIIRTPYSATIIAYEKMTFFAYVSIFEAFVKLGIVFLLQIGDFDKLILYAVLLAATKQAFESIAKYYIETDQIKFATLRLCDTYGPNDTRKKIFSLWGKIANTGETIDMSPGEQLIDICYIDDIVNAFILLAIHLQINIHDSANGEVYAIKAQKRYTLKELAAIFEEITRKKLNINWGGETVSG